MPLKRGFWEKQIWNLWKNSILLCRFCWNFSILFKIISGHYASNHGSFINNYSPISIITFQKNSSKMFDQSFKRNLELYLIDRWKWVWFLLRKIKIPENHSDVPAKPVLCSKTYLSLGFFVRFFLLIVTNFFLFLTQSESAIDNFTQYVEKRKRLYQ